MKVNTYTYGELTSGEKIDMIELHYNEISVKLINFGCRLIEINTPDRDGNTGNILLNYNNLSAYENDELYLGAVIGRCTNRIENGKLEIDDVVYQLTTNENNHHLHGGIEGFDKKIWQYEISENSNSVSVVFNYQSENNEEGYPGNLDCWVEYKLMNKLLAVELEASSDKATAVNMSIHPYFNLRSNESQKILYHEFLFASDTILDVDEAGILTSKLIDIKNTAMDFSSQTNLIKKIASNFPALLARGGFDHCYLFNKDNQKKKIVIYEPRSGRYLLLNSNTNLINFYTGNYLNKSQRNEKYFEKYSGFALEPQYFTDIKGKFYPYVILQPGVKFNCSIEMKFENE